MSQNNPWYPINIPLHVPYYGIICRQRQLFTPLIQPILLMPATMAKVNELKNPASNQQLKNTLAYSKEHDLVPLFRIGNLTIN